MKFNKKSPTKYEKTYFVEDIIMGAYAGFAALRCGHNLHR